MEKNIKLLIITHCFPANRDEMVGNFLYDFSKYFRKEGGSVTIFTPKMDSKYDYDYIKKSVDDIVLFSWKGGTKRLAEMDKKSINDLFKIISLFRSGNRELKSLLQERKFDYILSPWAIPNGYYASSVNKKLKIPYAIWALGSDINNYSKNPFLNILIKKGYKYCDYSFANSIGLCKTVLDKYKKFTDILTTNREIPSQNIEYREEEKIKLIFIGRLEKVKGADILIDAVHLSGKSSKINVTIFGDGSERETLEQKISSYGLSGSVSIEGFQNAQTVANKLKESDYLVISSRSEGMPVVFWEAMQTETPVISTNVGDIKHYCDLYNVGRTVEVDPKKLSDLISFIVEFRHLRKVLSKNCKKIAKLISIKSSAKKFYNFVEKRVQK
ncbi:MAG: hypothetical protein CSA15_03835 [Candidatus Delongbacteria bacterium]|nr:MAG: hypothetical protein CSA15_03835 [Candidatus Delongbacteria bacterium]